MFSRYSFDLSGSGSGFAGKALPMVVMTLASGS
jgi:hypothetical protein